MTAQETEKIMRRFKDLRQHLQTGEIPLFSTPAIWDSGQERHSTACDIIITNQRLFGYIFLRFPRERLFLDAVPLDGIKGIILRQKSFEPVFRELAISSGKRTIYIRAPRQKIERLYDALRSATKQAGDAVIAEGSGATESTPTVTPQLPVSPVLPAYGRQEMRASFERSKLALVLLFVGGLVLEIGGALLWLATQSAQAGLPLCIAGFVAVATATLNVRGRR